MKKLALCLLILLLAGGTVFYLGWIQIRLPADGYAVVFTKTGGFDSRVTRPGVFSWRWERLIPQNLTLFTFTLLPYEAQVSTRGALPSGDQYASILPEKPDFSYEANMYLQLSLRPDSLPRLVREQNLRPEGLQTYYERAAGEIGPRALALALQYQQELLPGAGMESALREELSREYPDLDLLSVRIRLNRQPDLELYALAKQAYLNIVKQQDASRNAAAERWAKEQDRTLVDMESHHAAQRILSEYGELFNKYPVLLKVLYLQNGGALKERPVPELKIPKILEPGEQP